VFHIKIPKLRRPETRLKCPFLFKITHTHTHSYWCTYIDHPSKNWLTKFSTTQPIVRMAPSDPRLFGPIKETFRGQRSVYDDDLTATVHDGLRPQSKVFKTSVDRWANCVQNRVEYVKKKFIAGLKNKWEISAEKLRTRFEFRSCVYSARYIHKMDVCVEVTYILNWVEQVRGLEL